MRLDARRDTIDFRDRMYVATLVEVPTRIDLEDYRRYETPILNQGQEGACTGFGLATVANYLLRKRKVLPDETAVSPRMLYEMAKRYDEFPGEGYSGSSARGAMKGWHKHGVCAELIWPYDPGKVDRALSNERAEDAIKRPLGAYFRVNHKDLVGMHSAIAEVGILYATGSVHDGWGRIGPDGVIPYQIDFKIRGGHAFAIVAYDERGFWIQNSWGNRWGKEGYALVTYDDWLAHGSDVWVARLGVPIQLNTAEGTAATNAPGARASQSYSYSDLRPHVISIGNQGRLRMDGTYGTSERDVAEIFQNDIPRVTRDWKKKRLLIYAHGGLVGETTIIQRLAEIRSTLLKVEVYPLMFIWHTDFWNTVTNILQDAMKLRKPEGVLSDALDFMLDRLDETLEPLVGSLAGKSLWDEMKENARLATSDRDGGARISLKYLDKLIAGDPSYEVHLVAHSAGGIFLAPFAQLLTSRGKITSGVLKGSTGYGRNVSSCTLWAPGIRIDEFRQTYLPAIKNGSLGHFALFTLTDEAEQDDQCGHIYHKSLLYLVSRALEDQSEGEIPGEVEGEPLLGLARSIEDDPELVNLLRSDKAAWIQAPNDAPENTPWASRARQHGDFDDDHTTLKSTLARILESKAAMPDFLIRRSASSLRDRRIEIT
jgi:hypothetical protein